MKFFNEYKRQLITLAVIALAVISFFTAGSRINAGFLGDDPDLDTVVAHLEHFLDLGGEKNVALGGDWDGCTHLPHGLPGIQGLDRLYERLLQRNYSTALLNAVFNQNLMRVVNEVCTM